MTTSGERYRRGVGAERRRKAERGRQHENENKVANMLGRGSD